MSVRTTADEKIKEAREHVASAKKALSEVVIDRCWGYEDYKETRISELTMAMTILIELEKGL